MRDQLNVDMMTKHITYVCNNACYVNLCNRAPFPNIFSLCRSFTFTDLFVDNLTDLMCLLGNASRNEYINC